MRGCNRPDARHLGKPRGLRVRRGHLARDALVPLTQLGRELREHAKQRLEGSREFIRQMRCGAGMKARRRTLWQATSEGFHGTPKVIDELGAGTHKRATRPQRREITLRLEAPPVDRCQQVWIDAGKACQRSASTRSLFLSFW